jgi:hypothetical protein
LPAFGYAELPPPDSFDWPFSFAIAAIFAFISWHFVITPASLSFAHADAFRPRFAFIAAQYAAAFSQPPSMKTGFFY